MVSAKEQIWLSEYLKTFNATEAARVAAYTWPNKQGPRLLEKYREIIKAELDRRAATAEEALDILSQHMKADMADYMAIGSMGFSLDLEQARALGITRVIKKVKQKTTIFSGKTEEDDREVHEIEIELYDAQAAADKVLRVHGRYKNTESDLGELKIKVLLRDDDE